MLYKPFSNSFYEQLSSSLDQARNTVLFVCPFIKTGVIQTLLSYVSRASIYLVTTSKIDHYVEGASDIECWKEVLQLGGRVFTVDNLHMKYFRFDNDVFLGSANLTSKGLGLVSSSNLEVMIKISRDKSTEILEDEIFFKAKEVYLSDYESYVNSIISIKQSETYKQAIALKRELVNYYEIVDDSDWLPNASININGLFNYYLNSPSDSLERTVLNSLKIPEGILSEEQFNEQVANKLKGLRLYQLINSLFDNNNDPYRPYLSFGTIKRALKDRYDIQDINSTTNAVYDWLTYFMPNDFYEENPCTYSRLLARKSDE